MYGIQNADIITMWDDTEKNNISFLQS